MGPCWHWREEEGASGGLGLPVLKGVEEQGVGGVFCLSAAEEREEEGAGGGLPAMEEEGASRCLAVVEVDGGSHGRGWRMGMENGGRMKEWVLWS